MLAGVFDPSGSPPARSLQDAFHGSEILASGPLALALTGRARSERGSDGAVCALEGSVYRWPGSRAPGDGPPLGRLIALHAAEGDTAVAALRGDFSLVLWNTATRELVLARDHMGGRGVVWTERSGRLLFATEVDTLLKLLPQRPGPDPLAMAHWLAFSGMPGEHTLYEGVSQLRAGCLLSMRDGRRAVRRYWAPRYERPLRLPREEIVDRLRECLVEAVRRRSTGADSAVMLSGGLDSSTVAALAGGAIEADLRPGHSYSAVFPDHPSVDESAFIDRLCDALSLSSTRAVVRGGSVLAGALPYVQRFELPPNSPNLFFWNPLLQRARENGTAVMLDGEGGDELFGLSPMLMADRLRSARLLSLRRLMRTIPGTGGRVARPVRRRLWREFVLKGAVPPAVHRAVRRARGFERHSPEVLKRSTALTYARSIDTESWKSLPGPRWWSFLVDVTTRGMGPALTYDHNRRRAALAGIEPRHPLVDPDVIELILRLPPELAFDPNLTRPLMREVTAGLMPDEVRLRPRKSSFDAVFHEMLAGPDLPHLGALVGDPSARIGEYVDIDAVNRKLLDPGAPDDPGERQTWAVQLWRMATAELWLRLQEDPDAPRRFAERAGLLPNDVELETRQPALSNLAPRS